MTKVCTFSLFGVGEDGANHIARRPRGAHRNVVLAQSKRAWCYPPCSNRLTQRAYDRHLYKDRNLVERFFNRLKQFRRIATRCEKLSLNFVSMINLACVYIWLALHRLL